MKYKCKISVIIPTLNSEKYINISLKSIFKQKITINHQLQIYSKYCCLLTVCGNILIQQFGKLTKKGIIYNGLYNVYYIDFVSYMRLKSLIVFLFDKHKGLYLLNFIDRIHDHSILCCVGKTLIYAIIPIRARVYSSQ